MWEQLQKPNDKDSKISMQGILRWLSHLLNLKLSRIQQLGSGAVYCKVFSLVHPGIINMNKVNWAAKNQYEFMNNFKLLQTGFLIVGINRPLQPLKLAKAKISDNFQLAIWFRNYYFQHYLQTDCTLNSSISSKADFSFAHSKKRPKHFNLKINRQQQLCRCCIRAQSQNELAKQIQILQVKLQMIRELVCSQERAEDKLTLIKQVIHLQYEQ